MDNLHFEGDIILYWASQDYLNEKTTDKPDIMKCQEPEKQGGYVISSSSFYRHFDVTQSLLVCEGVHQS